MSRFVQDGRVVCVNCRWLLLHRATSLTGFMEAVEGKRASPDY